MPYIKQAQRDDLAFKEGRDIENAGEINYVITELILNYYNKNPNYQRINDVIGALEGAKMEFYRRVAAPYEDLKIKENGDVY